MGKVKKALLITAITLVTIFVLVIAFISPIAKYLIEKYDVKYLGREVKIGWLYLNPFTAYIHISNLKIYEANSDSLFFKARGISVDFQLYKLFQKTYEINLINVNEPVAFIIQDKKAFNFDDVIKKFTPKEKDTVTVKEPLHFNILNVEINNGEFHYIEQNIPINYFVKDVNISTPGKWWDRDSVNINFALESGPAQGSIKGKAMLNLDSLKYKSEVSIKKFDLGLLNQYLQDLANYGHLQAFLDGDIKASGGFTNQLDLDGTAFIAVSDFHFGKRAGDDFASFDRLVIDAVKINPKNFVYRMDSIMIGHPFFKYEIYDELNNIERMFGKGGARIKEADARSDAGQFNLIIEIAKFVKEIGKNFLQSYYKIDKVAIYNADIRFNDFSQREKFSVAASPLYLIADSIDRNHKRFSANLTTGIKPYGSLGVTLSLDPNDLGNFDVKYKILNVPVSMFNPYLVSFTSFPLDRGKLEFNGFMAVKDSVIVSENHLIIVDPRVTKRIRKKDTKWLPVPFIMSIVRSSGNVIDFELPIRGSLTDPKFKIWKVIGELVKNIFVKPPSSGYLIHVKQTEQEVEKSLSLKWQMRQAELRPSQEKFIERMADFLKDNPEASITVSPMSYTIKEKEHILLYEAKKKFYLQSNKLQAKDISEDDSIFIEKMSVKDTQFIYYLDRQTHDTMMFTLQEKCAAIISSEVVDNRFYQLLDKRQKLFKSYFGEAASRLTFKQVETVVPFNGFSYYKLDYKGDIPEKLQKAYDELQNLNEEKPREKYKEKRRAFRRGLITEEREAPRKRTTP